MTFVIDLIDVNGRLESWDEISNDFNLGPIELREWYGIIQSIPSNWKEFILGNTTNREVYNSVSRDGETVIINNLATKIKAIKTRHIYKHLISGKVKEPSSKLTSIKLLISKRSFLGIKYIHCHTVLLLNQQHKSFNIKFSITFFI